MHKNFAKTLFLGKRVFFLPECHSTNDLMIDWIRKGESMEGDLIHTDFQLAGRGQRGNKWESEPDKNLLFSLHVRPTFITPDQSFLLNVLVSLALQKTVSTYVKGVVSIKWPNDIYVMDRKISGLLIQSIIEGGKFRNAIVGVGLNVNQQSFAELCATSLAIENGSVMDRESLLQTLIQSIESYYLSLKSGKADELIASYHEYLYRRGELHLFETQGRVFEGEIIGIDRTGRLSIREGQILCHFDTKEVKFLR